MELWTLGRPRCHRSYFYGRRSCFSRMETDAGSASVRELWMVAIDHSCQLATLTPRDSPRHRTEQPNADLIGKQSARSISLAQSITRGCQLKSNWKERYETDKEALSCPSTDSKIPTADFTHQSARWHDGTIGLDRLRTFSRRSPK
jgi:hypothetical protein